MAERIRLEDRECPLSATLRLVGEWWTLLILHDAFDGDARFDQFQDNLGISSSLLTSRLKRLVDVGLLERPYAMRHHRTGHATWWRDAPIATASHHVLTRCAAIHSRPWPTRRTNGHPHFRCG